MLQFVWSVASFGIRTTGGKGALGEEGRKRDSGGGHSGGKGRGGEGRKMMNSVWNITKFRQPKGHPSARILVDGPAQLTS